jgi:hypothetical protein
VGDVASRFFSLDEKFKMRKNCFKNQNYYVCPNNNASVAKFQHTPKFYNQSSWFFTTNIRMREELPQALFNTVFTPTRRQKPTHKSPTAAGMREHNRSAT